MMTDLHCEIEVYVRNVYLDADGQRGGTEVFLYNVGHPLRGAEQVRQFIRSQVTETLDRPYGTHQHIYNINWSRKKLNSCA